MLVRKAEIGSPENHLPPLVPGTAASQVLRFTQNDGEGERNR